jgi:Transmembrane secretion effector
MRKHSKSSLPPAFQRLAWSNLAAQLAEQIGLAAAPLVAVLTLGAGEAATGVLQTAQTLPFLLFSIPAGVWADRMPRARLMSRAEVLRVVSLLVILALVTLGGLNLLLLAVLGFIGACGTVAFSVAAPALVPALVDSDALPVANGRIELARTTAFAAGPALGGALVGWIGGGLAFAVAALLSASAVILLAGINEPNASIGSPRHPLGEVREGAAFVLRHPLLRPIFLTQFIFNTALFVMQGDLCAVRDPYAAAIRNRRGRDIGGVRGRHDRRCRVCRADHAPAAPWHRCGDRPDLRGRCGIHHAADGRDPVGIAGRTELPFDGRGPDPLGREHDHLAPDRDAARSARPRFGDQQSRLRGTAARCRDRRIGWRAPWGARLPRSRGAWLPFSGSRHPALTSGSPRAAAGPSLIR